jgi:hypothetical protein
MRRGRSFWLTLVVVLPLTAVTAFIYGFVCCEHCLPLYTGTRKAFEWSREQPTLRSIYYYLRGWRRPAPEPAGSWHRISAPASPDSSGRHRQQDTEIFSAVGYLSGYRPATDLKGVTINLAGLTAEGLNLVVSGHAEEAYLMDMEGNRLHSWTYTFADAYPDYEAPRGTAAANPFSKDFWRRCHLYENGDLLAIYDGYGLIKLNRDSELIWAVSGGCHHDMFVDGDGLIYVLSREARQLPGLDRDKHILEDFVTVLDPDGRLVRKVSLLEAFQRSSFASYLDKMPENGDIFHTNTIDVFEGKHVRLSPIFRSGNVLISVRNINVIAVVDLDEEKVVWALSGQWVAQHEPALLDNGNMLVFDNRGHFGMSKVIELDPFSQEIVWSYTGSPEAPFYTESSGAAYRLPGGHTLIVESNAGRAFEVTADGRIVWEFHNPHRAGENEELVATLFDVIRLGPGSPLGWLSQAGDAE